MNHYYCEEDGKLYFHGGKIGHKIDALKAHDKVSYCVYDEGYQKEGEWAKNVKCVILFGRAEFVEDTEKAMEISRQLSYKFTSDTAYIEKEVAQSGPATLCFAICPEHMTGKLVNEA